MNISEIYSKFLKSTGVCIDTRKIRKKQLFFALKGDNFDGNKYAQKALEDGASYAVIDDSNIKNPNFILVNDVLGTLQDLAKFHRQKLNIPIIGLTGSNGKTTTKELIYEVLKTQYYCTATVGNLNNHIGVPLTLLNMTKSTEIGIVEMGANHMKEIAFLSEIAKPNYGYITNIGKAHLEGFGSEENILIGKTELFDFIKKTEGIVFCNASDMKLSQKAKNLKTLYFSDKKKTDCLQIQITKTNPFVSVKFENTQVDSNLIGSYNYTNVAASILIGKYFDIKKENIKKAIENYTPSNNRSELINKGSNTIILDAYNANPSSMIAALQNLITTETNKKNTVVILGDMFELGKYSKKEHQQIIDFLEDSSVKTILLAGKHFSACTNQSKKIITFDDSNLLLLHLKKHPVENSLVLIKGSRGMKLEQLLPTFE